MRKVLVLLVALTSVLYGCGSGAAATPSARQPVEVTVTETDFEIESSLTNFQKGVPYRFVVTNKGSVNHEFMIGPQMMAGHNMSMEEMDKMALALIKAEDLPPGATKTVEVTFKDSDRGALEAACHVPGHYEAGMRTLISVN